MEQGRDTDQVRRDVRCHQMGKLEQNR